MADIQVKKMLAVINGFVEIPDGQLLHRTKLTPSDVLSLIPDSYMVRLSGRSEENIPFGTGWTHSTYTIQKFTDTSRLQDRLYIALPDYIPDAGPGADWFQILRDAAAAA